MLLQKLHQSIQQHPRYAEIISFALLISLMVIWGLCWPIMKIAIVDMPPAWVAVTRLATGALCFFPYLIISKTFKIPTCADLPIILSVGLLQMALFTFLSLVGLQHVAAGRSTILVYTTPLWVTPLAVFFFKEPLPPAKIMGLALGISGILVLFNPFDFDWHNHNVVVGNCLLIAAAIIWAICILHIRFAKWVSTPAQLLPWQMSIGAIFATILAFIFSPNPHIHWSWHLVGLLFYIGPIASALGYWMVVEVSRRLPAITTSLCLLGVPIFGLFFSKIILGEAIGLQNGISVALIIMGLIFITRARS